MQGRSGQRLAHLGKPIVHVLDEPLGLRENMTEPEGALRRNSLASYRARQAVANLHDALRNGLSAECRSSRLPASIVQCPRLAHVAKGPLHVESIVSVLCARNECDGLRCLPIVRACRPAEKERMPAAC